MCQSHDIPGPTCILVSYTPVDDRTFLFVQERLLGAQLLKLEEAKYVAVKKKFVLRKPQTLYRITKSGRQALIEYVQALKQLLGPSI